MQGDQASDLGKQAAKSLGDHFAPGRILADMIVEEIDGLVVALPSATRNMLLEGA